MKCNVVETEGGTEHEHMMAEKVVGWCIRKMMPRMKTLWITVEFEDIDGYGHCLEEDSNRDFTVTIRRGLNTRDLATTLIHEMIHVKQYARKELRNVNGVTLWKSQEHAKVKYDEAPWEIEAYALEEMYTELFFLECD